MKAKRTFRDSDPIGVLLNNILDKDARRATQILQTHRIETVGQFYGALRPYIPVNNEKQAKERMLVCSVAALKRIKTRESALKKIRAALRVTSVKANLILNALETAEREHQSYNYDIGWCLGTKKSDFHERGTAFWTKPHRVRTSQDFYVVPDYQKMGPVFDQGERGTCVANAVVSLIDYKTLSRFSRQFLYHQCKMIDGIMNKDGTYIESAFTLLEKGNFVDGGCVREEIWPYNPHIRKTEHHGPPPNEAFDCLRVFSIQTITPRKLFLRNDIITALNLKCPVVIGIPLYESFFSLATSRNGWVTMPLPGETIVGYHAMLIVGYDATRKLFLVRNSWSTSWASGNDKGYAGHAWIPFEYISRFSFSLATVQQVNTMQLSVEPEDQLWKRAQGGIGDTFRRRAAIKPDKRKTIRNAKASHASYPSNPVRGKARRGLSFTSFLFRVAVIILLLKVFQAPLQKLSEQAIAFIETNDQLEGIRAKIIGSLNNL